GSFITISRDGARDLRDGATDLSSSRGTETREKTRDFCRELKEFVNCGERKRNDQIEYRA
ncbi:hypothetical protein TorRG33x02_141690, partial [Trema orientale]